MTVELDGAKGNEDLKDFYRANYPPSIGSLSLSLSIYFPLSWLLQCCVETKRQKRGNFIDQYFLHSFWPCLYLSLSPYGTNRVKRSGGETQRPPKMQSESMIPQQCAQCFEENTHNAMSIGRNKNTPTPRDSFIHIEKKKESSFFTCLCAPCNNTKIEIV